MDRYEKFMQEAVRIGSNKGTIKMAFERGIAPVEMYKDGSVLDHIQAYVRTINGKKIEDVTNKEFVEFANVCRNMEVRPDDFVIFEKCVRLNWLGANRNFIRVENIEQYKILLKSFGEYLDGIEGVEAYIDPLLFSEYPNYNDYLEYDEDMNCVGAEFNRENFHNEIGFSIEYCEMPLDYFR